MKWLSLCCFIRAINKQQQLLCIRSSQQKMVRLFLLQTVRLICLSKFPEGKVEMWQVYVAWSDSLVLRINSVESLIGSELVKRTRPAKPGNSTHTQKTNGSGEGNTELQCVLTQSVCVSTLKPLCHVSGDDLLLFTVALFCRPGHLYYPVTILRFKLTRQSSLFLGEGQQLQGWRGLKELAADTGW